jgi:hypothetical protein
MPKKITSMQFKDRYKLANWLGSQRERIERERISIGRIIPEIIQRITALENEMAELKNQLGQ